MPPEQQLLAAVDSWPTFAAFALIVLGPHVVTYVQGRRTKALAAKAATDAAATRVQTENEHQDAEHPNLREQLDAMHADIREAKEASASAVAAAEATARTAEATARTLDEHVQQADAWQTAVEGELATLSLPWWRRR
jgi:phage shock protein A